MVTTMLPSWALLNALMLPSNTGSLFSVVSTFGCIAFQVYFCYIWSSIWVHRKSGNFNQLPFKISNYVLLVQLLLNKVDPCIKLTSSRNKIILIFSKSPLSNACLSVLSCYSSKIHPYCDLLQPLTFTVFTLLKAQCALTLALEWVFIQGNLAHHTHIWSPWLIADSCKD